MKICHNYICQMGFKFEMRLMIPYMRHVIDAVPPRHAVKHKELQENLPYKSKQAVTSNSMSEATPPATCSTIAEKEWKEKEEDIQSWK
jgi:hypothetical protein